MPSVAYSFDTRVKAIAAEHAGRAGRVVALLSSEPTAVYMSEAPGGTSFSAEQSELESVDQRDRPHAQLHLRKPDAEA